ncbi:MAG: DUF4255 domain-containing protein [Bacteroidetes bacterium]|nr:DUF4255 domain-containing protein [Bacteroidota bacterium]
MIQTTVSFIVDELNDYIRLRFNTDDDKVILSSISNLDGSPAIKEENKIIATLVGIEQERMINAGSQFATGGGSFAKSNPPIFLNLFILFSTSFPGNLTTEALRFIGVVIGFFQGKNVFTPENSPNLDSSIEKLVFNIYNTTFQEQNHLWAALGAKYVPSVL